MARPKVALISRDNAVQTALDIIDQEGLDAFSIRRLADRLGVNGASLYHHFPNKEAILVGAVRLALADARTADPGEEDWRCWLPRHCKSLRTAMVEHPELAPVIVRNSELGMGASLLESCADRLVAEGVPISTVAPLLEALETFAIGSAIHETRAGSDGHPPDSVLSRAAKNRALSFDETYDVVSAAIVEAVARTAAGTGRKATARTRPAATKDA